MTASASRAPFCNAPRRSRSPASPRRGRSTSPRSARRPRRPPPTTRRSSASSCTAATTTATRSCPTTRRATRSIRASARHSPMRAAASTRRRSARASRCPTAASTRCAASSRRCCRSGRRQEAVLLNVGTLIQPTTKAQYTREVVPLPPKLFSHNDQQSVWQSSAARGRDVGLGRAHRRPVRVGQRQRHLHLRQRLGQRRLPVRPTAVQYQVAIERLGGAERIKSPLFGSTRVLERAARPRHRPTAPSCSRPSTRASRSRSIDANESLTAALASGARPADVFPTRQQPRRSAEDGRAHDRQRRRARRQAPGVLRLARRLRHPRRAADDASRAADVRSPTRSPPSTRRRSSSASPTR